MQRPNAEGFAVFAVDRTALEDDAGRVYFAGSPRGVALEDKLFTIVKSPVGKLEDIGGDLLQRIKKKPFNQRVQLPLFLEYEKYIVIPTILTNEAHPTLGRRLRFADGDPLERIRSEKEPILLRHQFRPM